MLTWLCQAEALAIEVGAAEYVECSAKFRQGADAVFKHTARLAVTSREGGLLRRWAVKLLKGRPGRRSASSSPEPRGNYRTVAAGDFE